MGKRDQWINVRVSKEEKSLIEQLARNQTNGSKSKFLLELALSYAALEGSLQTIKFREVSEKILKDMRFLTAWLRHERDRFSDDENLCLKNHVDRLEKLIEGFMRTFGSFLNLTKR